MTPIDSSSFALPYTPDIDIRPRPSADTLIPLRPSSRCSMLPPQPKNRGQSPISVELSGPPAPTRVAVSLTSRKSGSDPDFSKQVEVFAVLPIAHFDVEAGDLGFLDLAVILDEPGA